MKKILKERERSGTNKINHEKWQDINAAKNIYTEKDNSSIKGKEDK